MPRQFSRALSLLGAAILLLTVVSCGEKKAPPIPPPPPPPPPVVTQPAAPPPPPPRVTPPAPQPPPPPPAPTEAEIFARMSLSDVNDKHYLDDVFFELDKADLSDASRAALQKDASFLQKWPSTKVTLTGHADSRGTSEYNLALGERRAAAARDYLVGLGVATSRISVVSKGKEQPFCKDEVESCWSQNRRGHFEVTAK